MSENNPTTFLKKQIESFIGSGNAIDSLFDVPSPQKHAEIQFDHSSTLDCNVFIGEFWTSRQRQAHSLHEVSYRACFKPQLPLFFIKIFTQENDIVYDPFSGRGTTVVEAALMGRRAILNDINPLSRILTEPRISPPTLVAMNKRLEETHYDHSLKPEIDLSMFYHKKTAAELVSIKQYMAQRIHKNTIDDIDRWIRMIATNRLTGHSKGFFSVYTLPPNQAVDSKRQILINKKLQQKPEYRDTKTLIFKKSKQLLKDLTSTHRVTLNSVSKSVLYLNCDARATPAINNNSVQLTVTSPPFLNVIDYKLDNWLRCWFNGIDSNEVARGLSTMSNLREWEAIMGDVFHELYRITKPGGWVAFEVGEVNTGKIKLEDSIVPLGRTAGFICAGIIINAQQFTKTSNIWGIKNNRNGTNTNRIVVFNKSS